MNVFHGKRGTMFQEPGKGLALGHGAQPQVTHSQWEATPMKNNQTQPNISKNKEAWKNIE